MDGLRVRPHVSPIQGRWNQELDALLDALALGPGVVPEIDVDLVAHEDDAAEANEGEHGEVEWLCADELVWLRPVGRDACRCDASRC